MSVKPPFILVTEKEMQEKTERENLLKSILTTLKSIDEEVSKVWSDEAREAAAEARRAKGSWGPEGGKGSMGDAKSGVIGSDGKLPINYVKGRVGDAIDGTDYQKPEKPEFVSSPATNGSVYRVSILDTRDNERKDAFIAFKAEPKTGKVTDFEIHGKQSWAEDSLKTKD